MEPCDTVLCLFGTDPQGDLHEQRDRKSEQRDPVSGEITGLFHQPASGAQVDLSGPSGDQRPVEATWQLLGCGEARICDSISGSLSGFEWLCASGGETEKIEDRMYNIMLKYQNLIQEFFAPHGGKLPCWER